MAEAFRERLLSVLGSLQPKPTIQQPQFLAQPATAPVPVPIPAPVATPAPPALPPFYFPGNANAFPPQIMYPYSTFHAAAPRAPKIPWHFLCVALLLSGLGLGIAITLLVMDMREQKEKKRLLSVK